MNKRIIDKYASSQTRLIQAGKTACLFLCLLAIAEEVSSKEIDFLDAADECIKAGIIEPNFFINDSLALLRKYTGYIWGRVVSNTKIDGAYVIVKNTLASGGNHFFLEDVNPQPEVKCTFDCYYNYLIK